VQKIHYNRILLLCTLNNAASSLYARSREVNTVAFNVLLLSWRVTFESLDKHSLHVAMHVIR